jgi:hypothetical protein
MTNFKAYIGETLIHWGMILAADAWSLTTIHKFKDFLEALGKDIG